MNCKNFEICQNQTSNPNETLCKACHNKKINCENCGKEFKKGIKPDNFCSRSCKTDAKQKLATNTLEQIGITFSEPVIQEKKVKKPKPFKKPFKSSARIEELEEEIERLKMALMATERELEVYKSGSTPAKCARLLCSGQPVEGQKHCKVCIFYKLI